MLRREKRTRKFQFHAPESLWQQLELLLEEEPKVISMSDYLYSVVEEHVVMRIAKQKLGRRAVNQ